jgi:DNA-binding response OmpR family regulator
MDRIAGSTCSMLRTDRKELDSELDKILVVDDEFILRDLMRTVLEEEGFSVITAPDGEEALTKANSEMPDLILLDLMMPGKSGLEVCKILKSQPETKHIPVVMATVLGREVDRALTKEAGADAHFIKPFSAFALLTEVRRQLDNAKEWRPSKELGRPLPLNGIAMNT